MAVLRCRILAMIGVSLCVAALGGCAVDHDKETAIYKAVTTLPPETAGGADAPPTIEAGEPLTLMKAMRLANANHELLALEGEEYLRAIIARRITVANFLPTVNLVPTYSRRDPVPVASVAGRTTSAQNESLDVPVDVNYNLFNGFRDLNALRRDNRLIELERHDLLDAQESLLVQVAQVYYQVLRSEASVRVLENSVRVQEERLRDTRARLRFGLGRPLDVAQGEAQLSATRTTLISARRDVSEARSLLAFLTGSPVASSPLADAYQLPAEVAAVDAWMAIAAEQRDDLKAAAEAIEAARYDVEVAFGQYYPSVSLNFSAFLYKESVPEERLWDGLLQANLPIFTFGRIAAEVREAWSFWRTAMLAHELLTRQVRQEMTAAYQRLAASEARLVEVQVQLAAAQQAFAQAEQSYQAGLATNLDRVQAQEDLLQAELLLASEVFDRKVLYLELVRFGGMLREEVAGTESVAIDANLSAPVTEMIQGPLKLSPVVVPAVGVEGARTQ